ncbi:hypothetical protein Avbf_10233 [Armadillidium vulgare]|nr:hypothetical protein Avbf_10233 [Armadillidium vulgare]
MAALYFYDKNVVEELRSFLKKENKNISQTHKRVIEKYVTEWDDVIHDPDTQEFYQDINHPFPELKTPFFNLPKEIEHMFKLMRMSARVYIELNRIINMLREFHWEDLVDKLVNYEVNAEIFFQYEDLYQMAFEMLKLTEMYFTRVENSYPSNLLPKIPISDFVSVGLSSLEDAYLKEPIKWVNLAKQQLFKRSTNENHTKHFYETYLDIVLNYLSFKIDNEIAMNSLITNTENTLPTYKQLCNGKDFRSPQSISHLKCYYDNRGAKWLFLMPAKVEVLSEDPEVLFFHDVLREKMINKLLQVALPLLYRRILVCIQHTVIILECYKSANIIQVIVFDKDLAYYSWVR